MLGDVSKWGDERSGIERFLASLSESEKEERNAGNSV